MAVRTLCPPQQVLDRTHKWAGLFLALGFVSAVATVFKLAAFRLAGEKLTYRLQSEALRGILSHSISWFDTRSPSPSGLAAMLASDTPLVQGVSPLAHVLYSCHHKYMYIGYYVPELINRGRGGAVSCHGYCHGIFMGTSAGGGGICSSSGGGWTSAGVAVGEDRKWQALT